MDNSYYVYILASERNGTLYTGVTSDLIKRIKEHKDKSVEGFTQKYQVDQLVYFADCNNVFSAIAREKQIKSWKRDWKLKLIEETNPEWNDLYQQISNPPGSQL